MDPFISLTSDDLSGCIEYPSEIIETSVGPVEYAIRGEGPVLVAVHGGPGGYDQGLLLAECFRKNGFKIVALSRPGYLRTPLECGASKEGQAGAVAALIDALGLVRPAVVGASAGGPSSYLLAQLYPDKVGALLEIDSVCQRYTKGQELNKAEEMIYLSKTGLWLMDFFMRHFPATMVKGFLETESTLEKHELGERVKEVLKDPVKLAFVQEMSKTMLNEYELRKAGVMNDLEQLASIDQLPLGNISCPALIMHGDADADVRPADAEYAHGAIKGSELYWIKGGSHIGFWIADGAEDAQRHALQWLREHVAA